MQLSQPIVKKIKEQPGLVIPSEELFQLPEKVVQFGTGVLLRGLPDYFIDKANRQGLFNGRVVVVKSTSTGGTDAFQQQDNLFTLCVRGIENGEPVNQAIINSSISRILSAKDEWQTILLCAHNPEIQVVISNTTEVGIVYVEESIFQTPPQSFPAKLLAFLFERYQSLGGSVQTGMVIVPTELIINNGDKLRSIVLELADFNELDAAFIEWIKTANHFCNSLVDRIVPGKLEENDRTATQQRLGYTDELMIMSESFRLWAIESDSSRVSDVLSFAAADEGVVIAGSIEKFRELKLRLLNGTHTFSCGLAHLAGFATVREAMADEEMYSFIHQLALQEIAHAISNEQISYEEACDFAVKVIDRFRNPSLDHGWINICVQYSSKMKMRNVPILLRHYSKTDQVPAHMALGFAAYLLFLKGKNDDKGQMTGTANGNAYPINDDHVGFITDQWEGGDVSTMVDTVLANRNFWGTDLSRLPGFAEAVKANVLSLQTNGVMGALREVQTIKQ